MIASILRRWLFLALLVPWPTWAGRGRPLVTATTVLSDIATPLRGTHWATDVTGRAPTVEELRRIRQTGGNALHLYGENFSSGTPVGSKLALIDTIVGMTRQENLYLVLAIGNGAANGSFDYDYTMSFWDLYAPRFAGERHVIYEVQNEPHQWAPGYPTETLAMERDAYNLIRSHAPDTPILLFSYAVFNNSVNVLTDIANLGVAVDWTQAAIAFHGYASLNATRTCLRNVLQAGYPCVCTEFVQNPEKILDVTQAAEFEDQGVSWLNFIRLDRLTTDNVQVPALRDGIVWAPDLGTWPVPAHPRHNLGGDPAPPFLSDLFSGGGYLVTTAAAIDVTADRAAPEAVYQSARAGSFTVIEPYLAPHRHYTVRLHFAETERSRAGERQFHVDVNGNPILMDLDILAEASAPNRALVHDVAAKANASGEITLTFRPGAAGEPLVAGVEFLPMLSSPWSAEDIGVIPAIHRGATSFGHGYIVIEAAGADIWETSDAFRYVHQAISGDCEIRAHVAQLQATHGWSKAGVMIRETRAPNSKHVMLVSTTFNGIVLQQRATTGGSSATPARVTGVPHPRWIRLVREGDTFTAYYSNDGLTWILIGSTTVVMPETARAGLAVTSHDPNRRALAAFEVVRVSNSLASVSAFSRIESESHQDHSGSGFLESCVEGGLDMGGLSDGSTLQYRRVDFGAGAFSCEARVASTAGGTMALHLDSPDGSVVGTAVVPVTGGPQSWTTVACDIPGLTGIHDLHLSITDGVLSLNWLRFLGAGFQPPLTEWLKLHFGLDWTNTLVAGDWADADGDGAKTLIEYALVGDPLTPDVVGPRAALSDDRLAGEFLRHPERTDIQIMVQGTDSLGGPWSTLAISVGGAFFPLAGGVQIREAPVGLLRRVEWLDRFTIHDPAHPHRFFRVSAQRQ